MWDYGCNTASTVSQWGYCSRMLNDVHCSVKINTFECKNPKTERSLLGSCLNMLKPFGHESKPLCQNSKVLKVNQQEQKKVTYARIPLCMVYSCPKYHCSSLEKCRNNSGPWYQQPQALHSEHRFRPVALCMWREEGSRRRRKRPFTSDYNLCSVVGVITMCWTLCDYLYWKNKDYFCKLNIHVADRRCPYQIVIRKSYASPCKEAPLISIMTF